MILLTRLDDTHVLISLDAIKYIEATPDTLIRFLNGDTLIVREPLEKIRELVIEFKDRQSA